MAAVRMGGRELGSVCQYGSARNKYDVIASASDTVGVMRSAIAAPLSYAVK